MFSCTCCIPARSYTKRKNLYRHQRLHDPDNYVDPRAREAQERRDAYYSNPNKCLVCETQISYEDFTSGTKKKFCSRSCAAIVNNTAFPKREKTTKELTSKASSSKSTAKKRFRSRSPSIASTTPCRQCSKDALGKNVFCSPECHRLHRRETIVVPKIQAGLVSEPKTLKKYLIEERGWICQNCSLGEWLGAPIPLELDHISGNPMDNNLDNLRLLCPNCHAQTPTAKGRNRGNGRWKRRQRYADGKSS